MEKLLWTGRIKYRKRREYLKHFNRCCASKAYYRHGKTISLTHTGKEHGE